MSDIEIEIQEKEQKEEKKLAE